jgi:hypothetical protein
MITQISMIFQCVWYLCNRFLIGVIRDFGTFSEISIILLDKSFFLNILVKKFSKKGGERKPSSYFAKCLLQNEGRMPVRKVRGKGGDKKEEGWANN